MAYFESNYLSRAQRDRFIHLKDAHGELVDLPYEIEQYGDKYSIIMFDIQTVEQAKSVLTINRHIYMTKN